VVVSFSRPATAVQPLSAAQIAHGGGTSSLGAEFVAMADTLTRLSVPGALESPPLQPYTPLGARCEDHQCARGPV
jgi:hypothetical protein